MLLDNAPRFGARLDASRLFLADIDGSGTADLIYVHPDHVEIWFNQSGNAFSEPLTIYLPSKWDRLNQIRFADVYGNGTNCLVFSDNHIKPRHWCYDFCQRRKPYLLKEINNNLGSRSTITYCSSTKFYLEDKKKGNPWIVVDKMRTRKVSERMVNGGAVIEKESKIYLGNYEVKRLQQNETTILKRQTLRVKDDETCVAIIHYWEQPTPNSSEEGNLTRRGNSEQVGTRKLRYQLDNHLGSVALEVNDDAQIISYEEYFPYGGTAFIAGKNQKEVKLKEYRYSGKERDDSTGLYYYGARYYAPWLGRWLKPDPVGTVDGLNVYAFVKNNPIKWIDPDGQVVQLHKRRRSDRKQQQQQPPQQQQQQQPPQPTPDQPNQRRRESRNSHEDMMIVDAVFLDERESSKRLIGLRPTPDRKEKVKKLRKEQMKIKTRIANSVEEAFSDETTKTKVRFHERAEGPNPKDHVVRFRDRGQIPGRDGRMRPSTTAGRAPLRQNVVYLATDDKPAQQGQHAGTGRNERGGASLERTVAHEFGHSFGLRHPPANQQGADPGELMHQTRSPRAGMNVPPHKMRQVKRNIRRGRVNQGSQQ